MFMRIKAGLTYANVIATLALFLALGGGAYAAFKLPKDSVGSKQIKDDAVNSSKVKNRSLSADDFKAGGLPAGAQGPQGIQGIKGDTGTQGIQGQTGPQGPGTKTFDGQLASSGNKTQIALVDGLSVSVQCITANGPSGPINFASAWVESANTADGFYSFGTSIADDIVGAIDSSTSAFASGHNMAGLDVVAHSTAGGQPVKYTRVDISVIRGGACNYHALIVPSS
jgi:hypothetical protein